jgi:membrane fusion protein, multidrug efflux system
MKETIKKKKKYLLLITTILVLAGLLLLGFLPKLKRNKANEEASKNKKNSLILVQVVDLKLSKDTLGIELPGNIKAFKETYIYARVNGYVKKWLTDIGTPVKTGQLLAELETPEIDQNLVQAKANLEFAKQNYDRVKSVRIPGAVSKQEADQYKSAFYANEAIVRQLQATVAFKKVTAPFYGQITARNIDQGQLISAGNTLPMFHLEQIDVLRIYVNLPQKYVMFVEPQDSAEVILTKFPPTSVFGKVVRTAGSLDPASRTLLIEIQVKNKDHKLMPGMYVSVRFITRNKIPSLLIPANTLIVRTDGPQVALVREDSTISVKAITIGRDYGRFLEITSGLTGNERLVVNPVEKITDGIKVNILPDKNQHKTKSEK